MKRDGNDENMAKLFVKQKTQMFIALTPVAHVQGNFRPKLLLGHLLHATWKSKKEDDKKRFSDTGSMFTN